MNRRDFQRLAQVRLEEARALFDAKQYSGAYYLAGYAVECALKACIAKQTKRYDFPDKDFFKDAYHHNLEKLFAVAGLAVAFAADRQNDAILEGNWVIVKDWDEHARYAFWKRPEAEGMLVAVSDAHHGVLQWLMKRW